MNGPKKGAAFQFGLPGQLPERGGLALPLPRWNQVHGVRVVHVTHAQQECGDCDALWTDVAGITVAVRTADCVPILLTREDGAVVAAIHAGWRGTIARIAELTVQTLRDAGQDPRRFSATVGPSIGPCCYSVSPDLLQRFADAGWPDAVDTSSRRLNLWAVNQAQLIAAGIPAAQVALQEVCTFCSLTPRYASFRRDATTERQWSWVTAGLRD